MARLGFAPEQDPGKTVPDFVDADRRLHLPCTPEDESGAGYAEVALDDIEAAVLDSASP